MMLKSFYTLEMYIQPGGGRQALLFIGNSIAEIKTALQIVLSDNFQLHLLLDYGEDIRLCTYQQGKLVSDLNLLPYITVKIENHGAFSIDKWQTVTPAFPEDVSELLLEGNPTNLEIDVLLEWSKLDIPQLLEPLLMPGETTLFNDHYLGIEITPESIAAFTAARGNLDKLAGLNNVGSYGWYDGEIGDAIEVEEYFAPADPPISRVVFR